MMEKIVGCTGCDGMGRVVGCSNSQHDGTIRYRLFLPNWTRRQIYAFDEDAERYIHIVLEGAGRYKYYLTTGRVGIYGFTRQNGIVDIYF